MPTLVRRFVLAFLLGAIAGPICVMALAAWRPGFTYEMDAPLPDFISGVYGGERDAQGSFAWTSNRVEARIRALDRATPWTCTIRFRGPRPEGLPLPTLAVWVDDARAMEVPAAPEYHDLGVPIPARSSPGLLLTLNIAPAFTPGGADPRVLGVQIDRLQCRPSGWAWPSSSALRHAAGASGVAAVFVVLAGGSLAGAGAVALAVALGVAAMLTTGGAMYGGASETMLRLSVVLSISAAMLLSMLERVGGARLTTAARVVIAISSVALFLKLIGLLHPAKPIIDAVFHAHRLERVMAGQFFFSQPFVGGVQMPYAIGLYVFAWPWAWLSSDHVAVIRAVTATVDVVALAMLYPVVTGAWGDRRAAALTVLAAQLAPLPYVVLGNANLANVFGQSVAVIAMAAAIRWEIDWRRPLALVAMTLILAWAICSHVSTAATLLATLGVLCILYLWQGGATRRSAIGIGLAAAGALVISWFLFYDHFRDQFVAAFARMFSGAGAGGGAAPAADVVAKGYMTTGERVADLVRQASVSAGWPLLLLAAIGAWRVWRRGTRDRLTSALIAWATVWLLFSWSTVFSKVDAEYVRYAAEFLGRVNLATLPLLAILAGMGASAGWAPETPSGARGPLRTVGVVLLAAAGVIAAQAWMGWFNR